MDAGLLVRSKYMVSREFGTGDIPREPMPTIAGVAKPAEADEATRDWWLVTFAEAWAKPLKVNTTHQQALILMFGSNTDAWVGKRICLYAMVGEFFKKRQTAVRIKGSPDLKEPRSFSVRKWGGGRDTYDLIPMGASSAPLVPTGVLGFGPTAMRGTQIQQLTHEQLATLIASGNKQLAEANPEAPWAPKVRANIAELVADQQRRAKLEEQMNADPKPSSETPF